MLPSNSVQLNGGVTRRQAMGGVASFGVLALATAGCGAFGATDQGSGGTQGAALKGQVRFSHLGQKTHVDVFQKLVGQFQQQNPGVQVTAEPTWNWDNAKYIAEAVAGDAADVVWTSENFVTPLFAKGVVQEVDAYQSKDKAFKPAEYFDTVLGAYRFRNKQVGLPILWGAYVMYYNKTLFERHGRKLPDDSWTWDQFLDAARALSRPSGDTQTMGQFGFETRWHENVWSPWIWNNGGELFNAEGTKCTLDSPAAIEGFQYLVDLLHRWKVAPTPAELTERRLGTNAFGTGKVGMVWNAIYFLPNYRRSDGLSQMEWDIAPIPKGKRGRTTTNPTSGLTMWKGSKNPEASWAFMRYLVSEEASKTYVTDGIDGMPVHRGAADLVLKDSQPPKSKQVFADAFKYAKPAFTTPYGRRAMQLLTESVRPIFNDGGVVRPAMTDVITRINAAMEEEIASDTRK
jgi:multiple sugar transport system substrate-binding protein